MTTTSKPRSVMVTFRSSANGEEVSRPWDEAEAAVLGAALPWRTFRWHRGQKHYSGTFWSSTERDHVIYESRLELTRLLFADFNPSVRHIVAQPFLLRAQVEGAERKHIPDYLLFTDHGPLVVDVKPRHRLTKPEIVGTFAWTKQAVTSRGWQYEVWSEPPRAELANIRFLAGYRRDWLFDTDLLDALRAADVDGATVGELMNHMSGRSEELLVRSTVFHLLWTQYFTTDLSRPLSRAHVLRRAQ